MEAGGFSDGLTAQAKKKIVAMKFLVAVPATYDFLRSKKDGKCYKLAPSTTGVMAKMFRVLNPKKISKMFQITKPVLMTTLLARL